MKTAWLISDDKNGNIAQAEGVLEALGINWKHVQVSPDPLYKLTAPWGPIPYAHKPNGANSPFPNVKPDIIVGVGKQAFPYFRAYRKYAAKQNNKLFSVYLMDSRTGAETADLIWVPMHDKLEGENVIKTLTSPHKFSQDFLQKNFAHEPEWLQALPHPRLAVLIGGQDKRHQFDVEDGKGLAEAIGNLAPVAASIMVTPSRRTPDHVIDAIRPVLKDKVSYLWENEGENPYPYFLAHADGFLVTGDSVNMTGEPCATGKPVYVFMPKGDPRKKKSFHAGLVEAGATRPAPSTPLKKWVDWTYEPVSSAHYIAEEIKRRMSLSQ